MQKPSSKNSMSTSWTNPLNPDDINAARDEALTDAYGDYEQHTAFLAALENELRFPFKAIVLGETVSIVSMKWPEGDEFGLDLIFRINSGRHQIDARSVELVEPFPDGHLVLAAYLKWRRFL